MNIHFLSSLLDIFAWTIFGLIIGYKVYGFEKKGSLIFTQFIFTLVSIVAGLFSVLIKGLPESGFAVNDFLYVLGITLIFYVFVISKFRKILIGELVKFVNSRSNNWSATRLKIQHD